MGKLLITVLSHTFHCNWDEISRGFTGVFALRWGPQWRIFGRSQLKYNRVISNHVYGKHEFLPGDQVFPYLSLTVPNLDKFRFLAIYPPSPPLSQH